MDGYPTTLRALNMDGDDSVHSDDETLTTRRRFSVKQDEKCSVAIPQAMADVLDCTPLELPEMLYDAVDIDAVDALFQLGQESSADSLFVSFEYCGLVVNVAPGQIVLTPDSPIPLLTRNSHNDQ